MGVEQGISQKEQGNIEEKELETQNAVYQMSRCRIKDLHDSKPDKKQNRHEEGRPEGGDFLSPVGQEKGDTDGKRQNVFGEIDRHVVAKVFSRQILEQEPDQEEIQAVSPTIERGDDEGRADKEQDNVREAGHIAGDDKNCGLISGDDEQSYKTEKRKQSAEPISGHLPMSKIHDTGSE